MPETLWERFPAFLAAQSEASLTKCEYFLPSVVGELLKEGDGSETSVKVLPCDEVWHGVTYPEDLQSVRDAIAALKAAGVYPERLWD